VLEAIFIDCATYMSDLTLKVWILFLSFF